MSETGRIGFVCAEGARMPDRLGPYLLGPNDTPENGIYTGDARELALAIPDESVDLIFTDPVYQNIDDYRWLAETAARVLKENRACLAFCGIGYLPETYDALRDGGLSYRWQMIGYTTNEVKRRRAPPGKCLYTALSWYEKGHSHRVKFMLDVRTVTAHTSSSNHGWSKPPLIPWYYLDGMTKDNYIILDPFTGGGTVPAVCKMLGRRYLAFEIDPATAETARQRVRDTQPPLFVQRAEQMPMEIGT
jgi:DNA modification methylase